MSDDTVAPSLDMGERILALEGEIRRLRGIIARNAGSRLTGEDGPFYVTIEDIKDSLEILYAEQETDAGKPRKEQA